MNLPPRHSQTARVPMTAAVAAVAIGAAMLFATGPFWWFGAGLVLGGLAMGALAVRPLTARLLAWLEPPRKLWKFEIVPSTLLIELGCVGAIFGVAAAIMPEAALGDRPVDHDHTVHYFKTVQYWQDFLSEGRFRGWSHNWFAGYPVGFHYPLGGELWVSFVYAASLGLLSFGQAYAVAFWLFWALSGYSVYYYARQGMSRWAGLIGAVLYMGNTANFRGGGWVFAAEWGVWPQSMAIALAVLAVAQLPRVIDTDRWRPVALFALFLGAAMIMHPMMIIHFAAVGPLALFALWVSRQSRPWIVGAARLVTGYLLGILIGGLWFFPFIASKDYSHSVVAAVWDTLYRQGVALYDLSLLPGTWGAVVALGFLGCVGLLWGRKFHHVLTGLLAIVFVIGGSTTFAVDFHLYELLEPLRYVHLERFPILLKPYWFVASGWAVVVILTAAARGFRSLGERNSKLGDKENDDASSTFRPWATFGRAFAVGFILVPLLVPLFYEYGRRHFVRDLHEVSERSDQAHRDALVRWFQETFPDPQDRPFFRVATIADHHDHSLVDLGARIDLPIYKSGFTPATTFSYKMESKSPRMLEALNVRYAISRRALPLSLYRPVEQFGPLRLYEFKRWRRQPFEVIEGQGEVELVRFDAEEIVLEAKTGAEGTLRLNVTDYPNWKATRDGAPVEIGSVAVVDRERTAFMTVPLAAGTYRFTFETRAIEWVSWLLFLLAVIVTLALVVADTRTRPGRWVHRRLAGARSFVEHLSETRASALNIAGALLAAAAPLALLALAVWTPPIPAPDEGQEASGAGADILYDFAGQLGDATVGIRTSGDLQRCIQIGEHFDCGDDNWRDVEVRALNFDTDTIYRCISAPPRDEGRVELHFDDVPAGDTLRGVFGIAASGRTRGQTPASLSISVDGREVSRVHTEQDGRAYMLDVPLEAHADRIDVTFGVDAEAPGRRDFCFNAQVVDSR